MLTKQVTEDEMKKINEAHIQVEKTPVLVVVAESNITPAMGLEAIVNRLAEVYGYPKQDDVFSFPGTWSNDTKEIVIEVSFLEVSLVIPMGIPSFLCTASTTAGKATEVKALLAGLKFS